MIDSFDRWKSDTPKERSELSDLEKKGEKCGESASSTLDNSRWLPHEISRMVGAGQDYGVNDWINLGFCDW